MTKISNSDVILKSTIPCLLETSVKSFNFQSIIQNRHVWVYSYILRSVTLCSCTNSNGSLHPAKPPRCSNCVSLICRSGSSLSSTRQSLVQRKQQSSRHHQRSPQPNHENRSQQNAFRYHTLRHLLRARDNESE